MLDSLFAAVTGGDRRALEARIEHLERQVSMLMELLGAELPDSSSQMQAAERIRDALDRRQTIEAIKHLRDATGCGLYEAKQAIDTSTWPTMLNRKGNP